MKQFFNIIDEYHHSNKYDSKPYSFETIGQHIGKINATGSVFFIYRMIDGDHIAYGAIERSQTPDPSSPKAILEFRKMNDDAMFLKNVWVDSDVQKRGIASEMLHFILWFEPMAILSDTQITQTGIDLCESISNTEKAALKIYNACNKEIYRLSDIGEKINGVEVIDPRDDFNIQTNQQWFYVIRKINNEITAEGQFRMIAPNKSVHLSLGSLVAPRNHFTFGDA